MNITINHLTKSYKEKLVLKIDDFHIEAGSFLGIIGPNGAGKSTLVKIIAGLDQATSGGVLYNGANLSTEIYQKMTMVFQKPYLLRTSVYNNIAYPLKLRKIDRKTIDDKVNQLLEEMDIHHIKNQNAWTLSGGEAQKVALARAIIFEPSLLVLDEPTANIDPASTLILERTLNRFYENSSPTIIIVTHNIQQAKRMCDHVAFMHQGAILEFGNSNDVIYNPKELLTKNFIQGEIII